MKIYSIGIGPGDESMMTPQALQALKEAGVVVGYNRYLEYIRKLAGDKEIIGTGMKQERQRAELAFSEAQKGRTVAVVSSGDSGVYGMAAADPDLQSGS